MAAVYGVNYTKSLTPTSGNIVDGGYLKGDVKAFTDTYEAASVGAASTIAMGEVLPDGAVILEIIFAYDALGTSSTISVGDAGSATRYTAALDTSSAGVSRTSVLAGLGYKIGTASNDNTLLLTTAGAAITGTVSLTVIYS